MSISENMTSTVSDDLVESRARQLVDWFRGHFWLLESKPLL
jgi:hypothetical protein